MNDITKVIESKDKYIKSLLEVIEIYEQKEANNKLLKEANELVELSYKAVIKEQKKVIVILSFALLVSIVVNFILLT